jgi:tRNA G26 N,N-dimethylase Trm1
MNFKDFLNESKETPTIEINVDYFEDGEYEATFSTTEDVGTLFKDVYNELNKKITFFTPASRLLKMSFDKKEDFEEVASALKASGIKTFKTDGKNTTKFLKQLDIKI